MVRECCRPQTKKELIAVAARLGLPKKWYRTRAEVEDAVRWRTFVQQRGERNKMGLQDVSIHPAPLLQKKAVVKKVPMKKAPEKPLPPFTGERGTVKQVFSVRDPGETKAQMQEEAARLDLWVDSKWRRSDLLTALAWKAFVDAVDPLVRDIAARYAKAKPPSEPSRKSPTKAELLILLSRAYQATTLMEDSRYDTRAEHAFDRAVSEYLGIRRRYSWSPKATDVLMGDVPLPPRLETMHLTTFDQFLGYEGHDIPGAD
jgi:hypothetical protein